MIRRVMPPSTRTSISISARDMPACGAAALRLSSTIETGRTRRRSASLSRPVSGSVYVTPGCGAAVVSSPPGAVVPSGVGSVDAPAELPGTLVPSYGSVPDDVGSVVSPCPICEHDESIADTSITAASKTNRFFRFVILFIILILSFSPARNARAFFVRLRLTRICLLFRARSCPL